MAVAVTLYSGAIKELTSAPEGVVGRDLMRRVVRVHGRARELCPVDKGRLRSSIRWKIGTDATGLVGLVGTDVEYALYVHEGTRPHIIRPINKAALFWPGADHPVMYVNHPGTRPRHFLTEALPAAIDAVA